jgi:acetyl-CoA C-acetyltransferase
MNAVIVSAVRTPIGKYGKGFLEVPANELGSIVVKEALRRSGMDSEAVDEVIMGNVIGSGLGQNPARQSALKAGFSYNINSFTVNKVCGSGLKTVMLAAQSIKAGDNQIVIAGGMENMSNSPYFIRGARFGLKYDHAVLEDAMIADGLWDAYYNLHMIKTGEVIAEKYKLTREEIDEFAYQSHMKAHKATVSGLFADEIIPVKVSNGVIGTDEGIRPDTTVEKLLKLKPVSKDGKFVTAGNASQLSDGASALTVMSGEKAKELGLEPLMKIIGYNSVGVDPLYVMEAPIPGIKKLLEKTGFKVGDIDLFEHNEAYASASVAVKKALNIPDEKFNVNGGAVALGHPLGASGARVLTTLTYNLIHYKKRYGIASLCLGGGNAVSMVIENLKM